MTRTYNCDRCEEYQILEPEHDGRPSNWVHITGRTEDLDLCRKCGKQVIEWVGARGKAAKALLP